MWLPHREITLKHGLARVRRPWYKKDVEQNSTSLTKTQRNLKNSARKILRAKNIDKHFFFHARIPSS